MAALVPFVEGSSDQVPAWLTTAEEAMRWAGVTEWPVSSSVFEAWHADPEVVPFFLAADDGDSVGYGELWLDESEVELARLVIDPARRGKGNGRQLVDGLVDEARRRGFGEIWLRVTPENEQAIRCYLAAGFVRTGAENEAAFNEGQPRDYAWMRHHGA